jgi:cytochrome d ubiquinol oxidase subunit I
LFFFTEAIFIAIYISGWKRLGPWAHFWTGVPVVIAGIGGTVSVIAANAWMNEPAGFTLNRAGKVVDVDPWSVIFNKAFPLEALHMFVAAYVVGGFLIASVYAMGMLRGRRDRYHRLGFIIPFTVAAVMTPIQLGVGDSLAVWVHENEPAKFAAMELVPQTDKDVPETLLGHFRANGAVSGGIRIPGVASILSDPADGTATIVAGRRANPRLGAQGAAAVTPLADGPTIAEANAVHLAWDVMVGLGTLLALLSVWYGLSWLFRRDFPTSKWFLRIAAASGVLSVITMEAGWVVTEVGRQPWIVRNYMKVEQAATANTGVWITFLAVLGIYAGLGGTTILVLRGMSRRYRAADGVDDSDVPYGPRGESHEKVPVA